MPSKHNVKHNLSLLLVLVLTISLLAVSALAAEADTAETVLDRFQKRIDGILMEYLKTTQMSAEQIQTAVDGMDWETYQTARSEIHDLEDDLVVSVESGEISEPDVDVLISGNTVLCAFSDALEEKAAADNHINLLGTTVVPITDKISITDTASSMEGSTTVNVTAKGGRFSQTTNTITITNIGDKTAEISFDYVASNYKSFSESSASGSMSKVLDPNGSFTMSITGKEAIFSNIATLTLSNFAWTEAAAASDVTFEYDSTLGSISVNGASVADGASTSITANPGSTLVATANSNVSFLGWVDTATGAVLSTSSTYQIQPSAAMTVEAVFVGSGSPAYYGVGALKTDGGTLADEVRYVPSYAYLFNDLTAANSFANSSSSYKYIVLLSNGTLPAKDGGYTISSGVTLLIPYDSTNKVNTTKTLTDTAIPFATETYSKPEAYRTLTMADGASLTVNGAVMVAAQHHAANGGERGAGSPTGTVGFIKMEGSSSITVKSGGTLYAWGFITGSGSVTAESNANIYEYFQFEDFRGGTQTSAMQDGTEANGVFPLTQYYVQNIEVPLTLYSGAKETVYSAVKMSGSVQGTQFTFIGQSGGMFNLTSGYVVKRYDGATDRLVVEIYGDMTISPISLEFGKNTVTGAAATINSTEFELPINGNITINVNSGSDISLNQDIALLPGSQLSIDAGATCTLGSGNNVYLYDADDWSSTYIIGGKKFHAVQYAPGRTYTRTDADLVDASIRIDGTVDVSAGYVYTTAGGANVYSTGSGIVKVKAGTQTVTHQCVDNSTYEEIPINSGWLKNADGTYVETAGNTEATTYSYIDGFWYNDRVRIDIVATNIAVNDGLDMWFYVEYDAVKDTLGNYKARVTKHFADDRDDNPVTVTIESSDWVSYDADKDGDMDYYRFKFSDISAKEMTDQITAVILRAKDDVQVSNTCEQTVQNYAIGALEAYKDIDTDQADALRTALMDMLEYGTSAQEQFKYNTSVPANVAPEGVETLANHKSFITATTPTCTDSKEYSGSVAGVTVSATNTLMFTFYFNIDVTTDMYATVSYVPYGKSETESVTLRVEAADFYKRAEGLYGVDVTALSIVDGRSVMTCTLYNSDGSVFATAEDSIEGYAGRNANNGSIFMNMMKFVDSACAYFRTLSGLE